MSALENTLPAGVQHSDFVPAVGAPMWMATVCGQEDQWLLIQGPQQGVGALLRARVAASCLLRPQLGDLVLIYTPAEAAFAATLMQGEQSIPELPAHCYVLSVLHQANPESSSLQLPGDAQIKVEQGQLQLCADAIALQSRQQTSLSSPLFNLQAGHAQLTLGQLDASATHTVAKLGELRLFARNIWTTASRVIQKMRCSTRHIEELDDVRAGRARWDIEGHAQMNTQRTTILAKDAVRVDGSRVDLG